MRQLIRTYGITGDHEITITGYDFTEGDIRLILNETLASAATTPDEIAASLLVASTRKNNVVSVDEGVITLADSTQVLNVGDELTIEIDIDNVAKQDTLTEGISDIRDDISHIDIDTSDLAKENTLTDGITEIKGAINDIDLSEVAKLGDDPDATITDIDAHIKTAKKEIMGADSLSTMDCGVSIPALIFDDSSFNCLIHDDGYWLDFDENIALSGGEIVEGDVLRASEVDAENGYLLCTAYTNPSSYVANGNVDKYNDNYYLNVSGGATFIAVEANKNYRCKEIVDLKYIHIELFPPSVITKTGKLYIWEEYEGENIHDGVEKVLNAIDSIDLSGVAQQGDNPDVSLTSIDEKIDDFYDTFDADIALQLQGIIGDTDESESESESIEGTSQTEQQISELRTLRESINSLANDVNALKDAHVIKNVNYDGIVFQEGFTPSCALDVITHEEKIVEINDDSTLSVGPLMGWFPICKKIRFSSAEIMDGLSKEAFNGNSFPVLVEADFPNLTNVQNVQNYYLPFSRIQTLRTLKVPKVTSFLFLRENGALVMDVWTGAYFNSNVNMSSWGCSTGNGKNLSTTSANLLTEEDIAAGFTSNAEKLLWNVRNHIAAFLPDRNGETAYTITFDSVLKAAILADTDTANAFADKNWTVA